ncbi:MAG: SUMF1/EgtB/PvdO family nonheme iron enzyme [Saprospiraceae bacterium]
MKNLASLKEQLKEALVTDGIAATIKSLRQQLPPSSPKTNALLQIHATFNELEQNGLKGVFTVDQLTIASNKLRDQLMGFIDSLEADDFDAQTKRSQFSPNQEVRKGHVLYQVPKTMQLFEESRCLVRIAFDRETLLEDLQLGEDTHIRDNVRLSEWMRVTIIDPASSPVFDIRTTSEAEQIIDEDDHTEWRFYVKPLQAGQHVLELKVVIMIVTQDGSIRPREKVLEETVVIVAESVAEEEVSFQELATDLLMGGGVKRKATTGSNIRLPKNVQTLAILLLFVFGTGSLAYAVAPQQVDWINTRYLQNTEAAYENFIDKYKEEGSPLIEDATYHKARVTQDATKYEDYIQEFEQGKFIEEATWKVAELTEKPEAYARYIYKFPDTIRQRIVQQRLALAKQSLRKIEPVLREAALQSDDLATIDRYLQIYPESTAKDSVLQRLDDSTLWLASRQETPAILPGTASTLSERLLTYTKQRNSTAGFQHFIQTTADPALKATAKLELTKRTEDNTIDQSAVIAPLSPDPSAVDPTSPPDNRPARDTASATERTSRQAPTTTTPQSNKKTNPPLKDQPTAQQENQTPTQKPAENPPLDDTLAIPATDAMTAKNDTEPTEDTIVNTPPPNPKSTTTSPDNMVFIKGGTFEMGDVWGDGEDDEKPPHQVTLKSFYLGRFEVTFDEYDAYCTATGATLPEDEGWGRGKRPAINVSWLEAVAYCNWRSEQEGFQKVYTINGSNVTADWSADGYRLPTEAEWEFAARSGGKKEKWAGTSEESNLTSFANGTGEKDGYEYTAPVGTFRANTLGLFDMSGNVWEWCWDWYGDYSSAAQTDLQGPSSGTSRVLRGGSWDYGTASLRCTLRGSNTPGGRFSFNGFRLSRAAR